MILNLPFKILAAIGALAVALAAARCNTGSKTNAGMEGFIIYDVSFPYEKQSVMLDLYPKELTFHFKEQLMHSSFRSSYDLLTTDFVIDNREKSIVQTLKNMGDKVAMELEDEEVARWLAQYPYLKLEPTDETETIAGYVCNKTIAHFMNDSLPPIEVYHTKGLGLEASNWWNQFNGIDGFLMGYDVQQYGKRMRLRAREVNFVSVSDDKFLVPEDYQLVSMEEMNRQMLEVVQSFMH